MQEQEFEVVLNGGLGNQLFGWALGYSVSKSSGFNCRFNISKIEGRKYELEYFGVTGYSATPFQNLPQRNRVIRKLYQYLPGTLKRNTFVEAGFHFQDRFLSPRNRASYYGYFQSYKYFERHEDEIRNFLNSSVSSNYQYNLASSFIHNRKPYAVHIRRGDYIGREHFHGLTSIDYFKRAIKNVLVKDELATFILFSDSPEITRELIAEVDYLPDITDGFSPAETLMLMSKCKGVIGSNSSFSWWAAYLMDQDAVKVFPRPWFSNGAINTQDLLPAHWVQLDNSEISF